MMTVQILKSKYANKFPVFPFLFGLQYFWSICYGRITVNLIIHQSYELISKIVIKAGQGNGKHFKVISKGRENWQANIVTFCLLKTVDKLSKMTVMRTH